MAKTIQPAKHINLIRDEVVRAEVPPRRFESMHRRQPLVRLHIGGTQLPPWRPGEPRWLY